MNNIKYRLAIIIKRRLASHPFLYGLVIDFYRKLRRLYYLYKHKKKNNYEWLYVTREQGLVRVKRINKNTLMYPMHSFHAHYEPNQDFSAFETEIKTIAYFLPQFHAIPENNGWWGEGFTEWTNTKKAKPLFPGHYQPREPHDDIGYYDLSEIKTLIQQVNLAKSHGIFGFCFYHYWFHGRRLLGTPVDMLLKHSEIDMPFCLCWANESWSRKWDGQDHHILIQQNFSPDDDLRFIEFLAPYFHDSRYIRVSGKPILLVYRINKLPDPLGTTNRWRDWARKNGVGELYLVAVYHGEVYSNTFLQDFGFDAYAEFPPHNFPCEEIQSDRHIFTGGRRFDYESGVNEYGKITKGAPIYPGCTLGWDNTPRFGKNANIFLNFSLDHYSTWLKKIIDYSRKNFSIDERIIFINAWNEWAEGAYLEPDKKFGYAYLNVTSKALFDIVDSRLESDSHAIINSAYHYSANYDWIKNVVDSHGEHSLAKANLYINDNSTILEFGPSSGFFTRYLKEQRCGIVDIVELDDECAKLAAMYARSYFVGDIEALHWKKYYSTNKYDHILFLDVLEHLRDPWGVLMQASELLSDNGTIILSLPNIAHIQIISSLYNNDFSYSQTGIMDRSHIRFFTERTVRQLIEEAGLQLCGLLTVDAPVLPEGGGTFWNDCSVSFKLKRLLSKKNFAYAMQFVACCKKA